MRNLAVWAFFFLSTIHLQAQERFNANVTDTYILEGAWVITQPGAEPVYTNIILKDGVISQIGSRIPYPANAEILRMDSMYIYAGFIAPLSYAGVRAEKKEDDQERIKDPGNPPNDRAGISPELSAFEFLDAGDKTLNEWRSAGFTTAHVVPRGKMLPGQSALINLNGNTPDEMLIKRDVAAFSQLKGARRMYPSTIIAVLAKWKELYRQAEFAQMHEKNYELNPVGTKRPDYDRSIRAFYPIINRQQAVFLSAPNTLDVSRAISLQNELGFDMVLSEVKQAWPNMEAVQKGDYMVLFSLDLPAAEKKDENESKDEKSEEDKKANNDKEKLKARKEQSVKAYHAQAASFEKSGIDFSFSYLEVKADKVKTNLGVMIENGLSEKKALEALTTIPANLLGIQDICGTVEVGKMANLTISDKPYFEKDAQIKYVFVDGIPFELKTKKKSKAKAGAKDVASGSWAYTLNTPIGERKGRFLIKLEEGNYTAFIADEENPDDMEEVDELEIDGTDVRFKFTTEVNGMQVTFRVSYTIADDSLEGSFGNDMFGEMPLKGNKLNDPK